MMTTPAITLPAGFTTDGRPVGLQIAGGLHQDALDLRAAAVLESVNPWVEAFPELARQPIEQDCCQDDPDAVDDGVLS